MPGETEYAVRVNEVKVNASRWQSEWWADWRRIAANGRTCIEDTCLAGDVLHVHAEDQEHAEWLAEDLAARFPAGAVKVIRPKCGVTWAGLVADAGAHTEDFLPC